MTLFETIILITLYLFAFSYMANSYGLSKCNTWTDIVLTLLAAGTIGIINFPMIFAGDIWYKLNNKE